MTKLEKKAALAVAAATAGVIVSGIALLRRHSKYLAKKAAATFGPDDENGVGSGVYRETEDSPADAAKRAAQEAANQRKLKRLQRQRQLKLTRLQQRKVMRQGQMNSRKLMNVK